MLSRRGCTLQDDRYTSHRPHPRAECAQKAFIPLPRHNLTASQLSPSVELIAYLLSCVTVALSARSAAKGAGSRVGRSASVGVSLPSPRTVDQRCAPAATWLTRPWRVNPRFALFSGASRRIGVILGAGRPGSRAARGRGLGKVCC